MSLTEISLESKALSLLEQYEGANNYILELKRKSQIKLGFYNTKYKYSSDYDIFYRMIVKKNMIGMATKKQEILGVFRRGGVSSRLSFIDYLNETIKIRLDNGQNRLLVLLIFVLKYLKNIGKI